MIEPVGFVYANLGGEAPDSGCDWCDRDACPVPAHSFAGQDGCRPCLVEGHYVDGL